MYRRLAVLFLALPGQIALAAGPAVPPQVEMFIEAECHRAHDMKDPGLAACIQGETNGYLATVALLSSAAGDEAAARYPACTGTAGDRYHRNMAACLGAVR